jgi:TonB family protein
MRAFIFCCLLALASPALALTPNLPAGTLGPDMVVQTRLGPMPNVILSAPRPKVLPVHIPTRGVYAVDLSVATGLVYSARVLKSSGSKAIDQAVLEALQQWRFHARTIYKLIVPIDFTLRGAILGGRR